MTEEEQTRMQEEKITYEIFQVYFKENPELDNKELYEKFPTVNQGTIRNWKSKTRVVVPPKEPITPVKPEEAQMKDFVETLQNTLRGRVPQYLLDATKDMDLKSAYIVLKTHSENLQDVKGTDPNTPIIPLPLGGQRSKREIDKYLTISIVPGNPKKNEINLEIPGSVALDPEKNKKLGDWQ